MYRFGWFNRCLSHIKKYSKKNPSRTTSYYPLPEKQEKEIQMTDTGKYYIHEFTCFKPKIIQAYVLRDERQLTIYIKRGFFQGKNILIVQTLTIENIRRIVKSIRGRPWLLRTNKAILKSSVQNSISNFFWKRFNILKSTIIQIQSGEPYLKPLLYRLSKMLDLRTLGFQFNGRCLVTDKNILDFGTNLCRLKNVNNLSLIIPLEFGLLSHDGTAKFMEKLGRISKLQKLKLEFFVEYAFYIPHSAKAFDAFIDSLATLQQVKELSLCYPFYFPIMDKIFIKIFQTIEKLPNLKRLRLDQSNTYQLYNLEVIMLFAYYLHRLEVLEIDLSKIIFSINRFTFASNTEKIFNSFEQKTGYTNPMMLKVFNFYVMNNDFTDMDAYVLSLFINKLRVLETLNLNFDGCTPLSEEGVKHILFASKGLAKLQSFNLNISRIQTLTNSILKELEDTVQNLKDLKELKLNLSQHNRKVTEGKILSLVTLISNMTNITEVELVLNGFTKLTYDGARQMYELCRKKPKFLIQTDPYTYNYL